MINRLAEALEVCLSHANESPVRIHRRIAEFPGLDENAKGQLLRRMIVENFVSARFRQSTKSMDAQLEDFAAYLDMPGDDPRMQKLLRKLIAVDISTSRAAIDRAEMKEIYPDHAKWIDYCLSKYNSLTYETWRKQDDLRHKRSERITLSDDYVIERHIGRGGLKDVYRVIQQSTGQVVAFKELCPHTAEDAAYQDVLRREAMLQAKLRHQGVPNVFTLNNRDATDLVFLERHISGKPWSELIDKMTLDENLRVLLRTANIVAFAHRECQVIHADLKPENVMIDQKYDEIYLVDWGLAIDGSAAAAGFDEEPVMGTPDYMAPESTRPRSEATPALDVFLLGGILYRFLTGNPPFPRHRDETPREIALPQLTPAGETISPELADLALKALDRDPVKRFPDATEFARALEQYTRRAEMLKHYAATKQRYDDARKQLSDLAKHTIELIEIANEFFFVKQSLQSLGDPSDDALAKAVRSEKAARLSLVDTAITLGDFGMAEGQLNLAESLFDPASTEMEISSRRRQIADGIARRLRDQRMKKLAIALGCAGLILLCGWVWTLNDSLRKSRELQQTTQELTNFEKTVLPLSLVAGFVDNFLHPALEVLEKNEDSAPFIIALPGTYEELDHQKRMEECNAMCANTGGYVSSKVVFPRQPRNVEITKFTSDRYPENSFYFDPTTTSTAFKTVIDYKKKRPFYHDASENEMLREYAERFPQFVLAHFDKKVENGNLSAEDCEKFKKRLVFVHSLDEMKEFIEKNHL